MVSAFSGGLLGLRALRRSLRPYVGKRGEGALISLVGGEASPTQRLGGIGLELSSFRHDPLLAATPPTLRNLPPPPEAVCSKLTMRGCNAQTMELDRQARE